jgi:glycosyltransferase involved in cell wall biosynthesis
MAPVPLMLFSDNPTLPSGLARITRDLAIRIHDNLSDTFRVGTLGFKGITTRSLPFKQYSFHRMESYVVPDLPTAWRDFAGSEKGILLSIWNPGWLPWLANPGVLPPSGLKDFLLGKPFERWIYAPIDAAGFDGKMNASVVKAMRGFNRVLFYSDWAANMYSETVGEEECQSLPHGIDETVFYPRENAEARATFHANVTRRHPYPLKSDLRLIGIVATNTPRKDWGLAFETCSILLRDGMNIGIWAHTDEFQKSWDLVEMANQFGLGKRIIFTNDALEDEVMARAYSACDVTLGIGAGEGFGYPLAESLACGTPVIHCDYAGGAEIVPERFLVSPAAYRWEWGPNFGLRPVGDPMEWSLAVSRAMGQKSDRSLLNEMYYWTNLWPQWSKWLVEGVNG